MLCECCVRPCCSAVAAVHSALASFSQLESDGWGEMAIGRVIEDVACKCDMSKGKVLAVLRAVLTGNKVQYTAVSWLVLGVCYSSLSTCLGAAGSFGGRCGSCPGPGANTAAAAECAVLSQLCHL